MSSKTYSLAVLEGNPRGAAAALLDAIERKDGGAVRTMVRTSPIAALIVIRMDESETGLSTRLRAEALEMVVEETQPDLVRELLEEHLTSDLRSELVAARGDLPSAAAMAVSIDDVFAALLKDMEGARGPMGLSAPFHLKAWAIKLRDRSDYEELLKTELVGIVVPSGTEESADADGDEDTDEEASVAARGLHVVPDRGEYQDEDENPEADAWLSQNDPDHEEGESEASVPQTDEPEDLGEPLGPYTFEELLAVAVYLEDGDASVSGEPMDVPTGSWDEVGLAADHGVEIINHLRSTGQFPRFTRSMIARAKALLAQRKQEAAAERKADAKQVRTAATRAAKGLTL